MADSPLDTGTLDALRARWGGKRLTSGALRRSLGLPNRYEAAQLFAVLSGRRRTVSVDEAVSRVAQAYAGGREGKLQFLFDLHGKGRARLRRSELKALLDAALRDNELPVSAGDKAALLRLLLKEGGRGGLDFADFKRLVKSQPEVLEAMLRGLDDWFAPGSARPKRRRGLWGTVAWMLNTVPSALWRWLLVLGYAALNGWLAWSAWHTYEAAGAPAAVQVARAAGAVLNLNGALILVPMLRGLLGALRRLPLSRLVPIDDPIELHRLFGNVLFFGGLIHTGAHLVNYLSQPVPLEQNLLHTLAGATGLAVLVVLFLMWLLARGFIRRTGRFELFFFSHSLYGAWFLLMLLHAPHFWMWAAAPLALYVLEWLRRRAGRRAVPVESVVRHAGDVTEVRFAKPPKFRPRPGDYVFLKMPALSRLEWHPFTLSSAPEQDDLSVHVRAAGNWTRALARLAAQDKRPPLSVVVDGPHGTPTARLFRSKHLVLVGAGIGVTPFASVLRSLLARRLKGDTGRVESVTFVWLNRGQASFAWFGSLLSELEGKGQSRFFDLRIYLTNASTGPLTGLATLGLRLLHRETREDAATGLKARTRLGRPDWDALFQEISQKRGLGVSVFYCGPAPLADEVRSAARQYGFGFRKENF